MSLELFVELERPDQGHQLLEQRGAYTVSQHQHYRYLSSGGRAIQGAMNVEQPMEVQSPVVKAMLEGLALSRSPLKALNLGVGCAAIERFLADQFPETKVSSVDVSKDVIDMARRHFELPASALVECAAAESFVDRCFDSFDVVFCDLAIADQPASCLSNLDFQKACHGLLTDGGIFILNLLCDNNADLRDFLLQLRTSFAWLAVHKVAGFDNVVVYAGLEPPFSEISSESPDQTLTSMALSSAVILA
ncbi:MAG: spermidine synthase [Pseudomonadales bacterium]